MTSLEQTSEITENTSVKIAEFSAQVTSHPARSSMAQSLAGQGKLVFEGEMLETPLAWHPAGTRH